MYGKSSYDELKDGQPGPLNLSIAIASLPRSEPTRAPAQVEIDAGADPGQASRKTEKHDVLLRLFLRFDPTRLFLKNKQQHQPLQAEFGPLAQGSAPNLLLLRAVACTQPPC